MLRKSVILFSATRLGDALHTLVSKYRSRNLMPRRPRFVHIETTSLCNGRCIMCGHRAMQREKATMDDELFDKIAAQVASWGVEWVNLQFYGEPLLDKRLFERITRLKKDGLKVKLNTNASLLTKENARKLLDTGIDQVNISFDAFSKEEYNKIRVGLDYDKVIANIETFLDMKQNTGTRAMMTFVCLDRNKHEAELFRKKWKGKSDKVLVTFARDWAGQLKVNGGSKQPLRTSDRNICKTPWNDLVILQDGTVTLCCSDYEGLVKMGNLNSQTLDEVWNGKKFVHYRQCLREGRRGELKLCNCCHSYSYWWTK